MESGGGGWARWVGRLAGPVGHWGEVPFLFLLLLVLVFLFLLVFFSVFVFVFYCFIFL